MITPSKTAWHHIRRSPFQSIIATLVMFVSFFSLSSFLIISRGLSSVLKYFETRPEITIFLKDGLDKLTVESLQKELTGYPDVREIKYISKEKALSIYKEQNKDNPLLTEMVTASILPASFEVSVSNPEVLQQIALNFSAKTSQIDEIIYQKDVIASLLNWTNIVRKTGLSIVVFISLFSLLVVSAVISMKVTNRKDEVRISRLLGASRFYVKKPFLLEGIFFGLLGGFLGSMISIGISWYFKNTVNLFFQPVEFIFTDINFYLFLVVSSMFFGLFLGYLASWVSVKRYIKF
jgi:cell division transport system permease protein